jgi:hypothetical protein
MRFLLILFISFSLTSFAQKGCLCKDAKNYNVLAIENDGSCLYKKTKTQPIWSKILDEKLHETSGLIKWQDEFLTHNDDTENWLYRLDPNSFEIKNKIELPTTENMDWEAIAQDSLFFYVGDFGNNNGSRQNLCIYQISKHQWLVPSPIEKISFEYGLQKTFEKAKRQNNFDCEAMVVKDSLIFLFTKNWLDQTTDVYYLPKQAGHHIAKHLINLPINGLVTDACLVNNNEIIICGYNKKLKPFIIKIKDFNGLDFSLVNLRRYKLKLPFHQIEGVFSHDGQEIWLTNEKFERKGLISVPMKIHYIKL